MSSREFTDFEDLKVTTITLVFTVDGFIEVATLFWFLKLNSFPTTDEKFRKSVDNGDSEKKKKILIPHYKNGGIITARYEGVFRGSLQVKKCFKNSITCDIGIPDKNLSVKISREKIHITGAKSLDHGRQVSNLLLNHIHELQNKIVFPKDDPAEVKKNLLKISEILDSTLAGLPDKKYYRLTPQEVELLCARTGYQVPVLNDVIRNWLEIESVENILLFSKTLTLINPENCTMCRYNYEAPKRDKLSIAGHSIAMINYNYKLGFEINRERLAEEVKNHPKFIARYNKMVDHAVNIVNIYRRTTDDGKKKPKNSAHTFIVYKSGIVTQSGPGGKIMEDIYNEFMKMILLIKDRIIFIDQEPKILKTRKKRT